jgi:thymidylate kinase
MNRVICLIGMDGSGKTTHSRRMMTHLEESGVRCRYVWFGTAYFLSYPFMVICRWLSLTKTHYLGNGLAVSEHQYYKNQSISSIWPWIQFLDAMVLVNLRVKPLLWRGFTVVCDRFIPDILVELMADVNDERLCEKLVGRLMLKLMPRSSLVILLHVDEKTAWQRKNDVPELRYLSRRKDEYYLISHNLKIPMVNAEGSIASVQRRVISLVDAL